MNEVTYHIRHHKIHVKSCGDASLPVVVFLHGFTGSVETWTEITGLLTGKYRIIAVDLTGHGKSAVPEDPMRYIMAEQVADLEALFDTMGLDSFTLVGYSMGGRIALAYAIHHPGRVTSLILESASPGLKTELERVMRRTADQQLAQRIIREGLPAFIDFWEDIPLFKSQKRLSVEKQQAVRDERLGQCATGLANSLLGIGTGSQPSFWEKLHLIQMPVLLITGEMDTKFVAIAREMKKFIPFVNQKTVENAGHAIHVEKPKLFATMVEEHVTKAIKLRG